MKKMIKGLLIAGGILVLVGGITAVVSVSLAFQKGETKDLSWKHLKGISVEEHYGTPEVKALCIDLEVGELSIVTGSEYAISAEGVPESFQSKITNGVWEISLLQEEKGWWSVDFGSTPEIVVTVPENCFVEQLELDVGVGALQVASLSAGELDIDCGTGKVEYCGQVSGNIEIDCGVGHVAAELLNAEADFGGNVSCGVGKVTIGKNEYSGMGNDASFGSSRSHHMNVECDVGNVEISFAGAGSDLHHGENPTAVHEENHGADLSAAHGEDHGADPTAATHDDHETAAHEEALHAEEIHDREGGEIHGF